MTDDLEFAKEWSKLIVCSLASARIKDKAKDSLDHLNSIVNDNPNKAALDIKVLRTENIAFATHCAEFVIEEDLEFLNTFSDRLTEIQEKLPLDATHFDLTEVDEDERE